MKLGFRENWRVWLLVLFVLVSTVAIFAPLGGGSDAPVNSTDGTNDTAATQSTASEYTNLSSVSDWPAARRCRLRWSE